MSEPLFTPEDASLVRRFANFAPDDDRFAGLDLADRIQQWMDQPKTPVLLLVKDRERDLLFPATQQDIDAGKLPYAVLPVFPPSSAFTVIDETDLTEEG